MTNWTRRRVMIPWSGLVLYAVLAGFPRGASAQVPSVPATAPAGRLIADFEGPAPARVTFRDVDGRVEPDPAGGRALRLSPAAGAGENKRPTVILDARPAAADGGLSAELRAVTKGDAGTVKLRWLALDERNAVILQRRVDLDAAGGAWRDVAMPWTSWRWGNGFVGARADVRRIALVIESPPAQVGEVWLDDVRWTAAPATQPAGADWLRRLAFEGRDARSAEADGLLVATDALAGAADGAGLTEADLLRVLGRMRQARALVRRLFGDAVRPVDGATPAALLVFRDKDGYTGFWQRLGAAWGAEIAPPTAGGYTVQDVAASTYDPRQGASRPVYLHEAVHAILAHDVRLIVGDPRTSWLHEGVANYVQVCAHPASLDRKVLAAHFGRPIAPDGSTFFQPLARLLGRRADPRTYAQLATLVAYLAEERPQVLPTLAKELASGTPAAAAVERCGTSIADLEAAWFAWGKARYAAGAGKEAEPIFPVPRELTGGAPTGR